MSLLAEVAWNWGDKSDVQIPMALFYALLGILVVFAVLFILILIFTAQEQIFKHNLIDRATAAVKNFFKKLFKKKPAQQPPQDSATEPVVEDEEEVMAAIMAAVTVILQEESEDGVPAPFTIRSVKRNHTHCH